MSDEQRVEITISDLRKVEPTPILNLPDIIEEACYVLKDGTPYRIVFCRNAGRPEDGCPACGSEILSVHGYLKDRRLVHDVRVGVEQVDLYLRVPRYRCEDCGATFTHKFESVMEKRQMTYRLYDQIRSESFSRPFTDVANDFGYTVPTIAAIFDEYTKELEENRGPVFAPRVLGIDEKHIAHAMRGVFVDIETSTLLEMTPTNKRSDVMGCIESMVDYDKNIELVTMDMSGGYRSWIQECLPKAKIIVDKYHVIQLLSTKVKKTRTDLIDYRKSIIAQTHDPEEAKRMKAILAYATDDSYLFKYNKERLKDEENRIVAMAELCQAFPEFNHLRLLKEGFEEIYRHTDRSGAEAAAEQWSQLVPPKGKKELTKWESQFDLPADLFIEFQSLKNTLKNWKDEIFNYFEPGNNVTNAATEGLNNLIERFNRAGNGYGFDRLRAKALYGHMAAPRCRYIFKHDRIPVYDDKSTALNLGRIGMMYKTKDKIIGYKDTYSLVAQDYIWREEMNILGVIPDNWL